MGTELVREARTSTGAPLQTEKMIQSEAPAIVYLSFILLVTKAAAVPLIVPPGVATQTIVVPRATGVEVKVIVEAADAVAPRAFKVKTTCPTVAVEPATLIPESSFVGLTAGAVIPAAAANRTSVVGNAPVD